MTPEAALAAYNAGEDRVAEWTMGQNYEETAEFVESIPFTETREYVQIVLRNAELYRQIYATPQPPCRPLRLRRSVPLRTTANAALASRLPTTSESEPRRPEQFMSAPESRLTKSASPANLRRRRSSQAARKMLSAKAERFTESVIREMTRLAMQYGAVNLAQGFPDFPAPAEIKEAARAAIAADVNQYAITWGAKPLRDAIVEKFARTQGVTVDPEREITVCCGSTEAMMSAMMAIINPGDEVVIFEPFYENYGPDAILSGAHAALRAPASAGLELRPRRTGRAPSDRAPRPSSSTRPTIPPARSSPARNSKFIRDLCVRWDAFAITDEIYEHILYDGAKHISHGLARRHARSHHHDQRHVQDLQRHRLARRLGHRAARSHRGHSQGARFPDGRRRGAAAGRRRRGAAPAGELLPRAWPRATAPSATACSASSNRPASAASSRRAPTTS